MNNQKLTIVQLNMARSMAVTDELYHYCTKENVDVALVQEPYTRWGTLAGLEVSATRVAKSITNEHHGVWAAIVVFNNNLDILLKPHLTTMHTVTMGVAFPGQSPVDLVSSYFQYRRPTNFFTQEIRTLHPLLSRWSILALDVNAFSHKWYDHRRNDKGRLVESMITDLDLTIQNREGNEYTFQGTRGSSNVDITLASTNLASNICDWRVNKGATSSDHLLISFSVQLNVTNICIAPKLRYKDHKIDKNKLVDTVTKSLESMPRVATINGSADRISKSLQMACDKLLPKQSLTRNFRPPWWNQAVNASGIVLNRAHRAMLRTGTPESRECFRAARNRHVSNIRAAKKAVWVRFTEEQSNSKNIWGKLTKWLIKGKRTQTIPSTLKKQDGSYTMCLGDTVQYMLEELIPTSTTDTSPDPIPREQTLTPPISVEELRAVVLRQKNKAPGADGLSAKIIKSAWPAIEHDMHSLVNNCLKECRFPDPWKNASLVVLLKAKDKDPLVPKSYRPVSLLPVLGKIVEEVICNILELEVGQKLSPRQHGFRPGKSTMTALSELQTWVNQNGKHVLGTFLDISGAFDNVRWPMLIHDMRHLGCSLTTTATVISYLTNRSATYRVGGIERTVTLTRGCPQGSKLGPRLWNLTMDRLLKENLPVDSAIVAYADDITLLVSGNTRKSIVNTTEEALRIISEWGQRRGLSFSKEKSIMIPLKGGLTPGFTVAFGQDRIKSTLETKYLGLQLGANLDFGGHAMKLLDSSTDTFSRLKAVRKSKWGVSSCLALILYRTVYIPRITYGADIWYPSITKAARNKLVSAQRRVLLAITAGYKTVSTRALQVVAGTPPIQLQIEMSIRIQQGMPKSEAENICITEWQILWDNSTKGRWTYSFFPDIRQRITTPITIDHYTTQLITGHGDFQQKLHGFSLTDSPLCSCGSEEETAEHILVSCTNTEAQGITPSCRSKLAMRKNRVCTIKGSMVGFRNIRQRGTHIKRAAEKIGKTDP